MTPAEAGVVLDALVAAYPARVMGEDTVRIYARFLADVNFDVGIEAVARWIATCKTFPSISELRGACDVNRPPDSDVAFAEVMRAVSRFGIYAEPLFSHAAVRAAVESITWREVCNSTHAPSLRAHFDRAYEAAKKRTIDPAHARLVAGVVADVKQRLVMGARKELKP